MGAGVRVSVGGRVGAAVSVGVPVAVGWGVGAGSRILALGGVPVGMEVESATITGGVPAGRVSQKTTPPTPRQINNSPRTATTASRG